MEIKFSIICIFFTFLISCDFRDYTDDLGGGYQYSFTSSIGRRIVNNFDTVVDTAVLGYLSNEEFIAVVRLVAQRYECKSKRLELSGSVSNQIGFVDKLEYYLIDKNTNEISIFSDKDYFYSQLNLIEIKEKIEIDQKLKSTMLKKSPLEAIDLAYCQKRI